VPIYRHASLNPLTRDYKARSVAAFIKGQVLELETGKAVHYRCILRMQFSRARTLAENKAIGVEEELAEKEA
jgi:hypothetical protein